MKENLKVLMNIKNEKFEQFDEVHSIDIEVQPVDRNDLEKVFSSIRDYVDYYPLEVLEVYIESDGLILSSFNAFKVKNQNVISYHDRNTFLHEVDEKIRLKYGITDDFEIIEDFFDFIKDDFDQDWYEESVYQLALETVTELDLNDVIDHLQDDLNMIGDKGYLKVYHSNHEDE